MSKPVVCENLFLLCKWVCNAHSEIFKCEQLLDYKPSVWDTPVRDSQYTGKCLIQIKCN